MKLDMAKNIYCKQYYNVFSTTIVNPMPRTLNVCVHTYLDMKSMPLGERRH